MRLTRCNIMKNSKKLLAWLLMSGLTVVGASAESAALPRAAVPVEIADLERYPSCAVSEETGRWSVRANSADALLDRFWTYAQANSTSVCAFGLEIEGDADTGVWSPVLRMYYSGSRELNATAVCVLADGMRYTFAASSEEIAHEGDTAERISVPLTREAVLALRSANAVGGVSVRIIGEKTYTFELDPDATGTRSRIEAASLSALDAGLALLNAVGFDGYELWDLSAADWENVYGVAPAFESAPVVMEIGGESLSDDFGMVEYGDQTRAAKAAQQALIDAGFMSGSASGTFGENSASAARRAQHWLGLIETGCMDAQLEKALKEGVCIEETDDGEWQNLGAAQLQLNRWWFAGGVSATNAPESVQSAANTDNTLAIADGMIRNVSADDLKLFTQVSAKVIYNGTAAYDATVLCECDGGTRLDMTMLPMAQARLVVFAEVPGWLAEDAQAQWSLQITIGGETMEYELQ